MQVLTDQTRPRLAEDGENERRFFALQGMSQRGDVIMVEVLPDAEETKLSGGQRGGRMAPRSHERRRGRRDLVDTEVLRENGSHRGAGRLGDVQKDQSTPAGVASRA